MHIHIIIYINIYVYIYILYAYNSIHTISVRAASYGTFRNRLQFTDADDGMVEAYL